ncbi:hypothetical protein N7532_012065 [Penicillium argentinense]|uniref:Inner centromere protein ARK-binding domain-containing protein n=1 Tax=Penicillium argentinense TaxID=1131581 RepID=A0A9W9EJM1_9EURO|nr:uncharacterized protein N7532_012065 [Penicillium argentinense]KAJ5083022.1 hypothetical protein N7532_012065 [Penicillium argentinense]
MAAAGARAQKPIGSAAWIAAEKENVAELVDQEMEEVEYPVRHELDWLNEHMAEIFSKGQASFTDVFKTPGKMRGKTPRTTRKRNVDDDRVPLSEIFSSAHKQVENKAVSPSPFIHRVISRSTTSTENDAPRIKEAETSSQPQYPDLSQNLNSFEKYNTDSGYHGMEGGDEDEMVLTATQPESQTATQPFEADEPIGPNTRHVLSMSQRTTEDSFHSAQENVRARGETVEPMNIVPTPTQDRTVRPAMAAPKEPSPELSTTPKVQPQGKPSPLPKSKIATQDQRKKPAAQEISNKQNASNSQATTETVQAAQPPQTEEPQMHDAEMQDLAKEETMLDDNFDDIGSPSDGSTPERLPVRKSSLSFASLPAREPLTKKSMGGTRISRTSHIDLAKLSNKRNSNYLGKQPASLKVAQPTSDDNAGDGEKRSDDNADTEQASRLHIKNSTQSLHERISMLGKPQARPNKSISATAGISIGQIAYPELPATKAASRPDSWGQKAKGTPAPGPAVADDDWIKPPSSPYRPNPTKGKTTDVMEKLFDTEKDQPISKKGTPATKEQHSTEPERPKSSASIFSSPRPQGHQQSASTSVIAPYASTTPTGSPRRFDGPLSASKLKLHSMMKSAKGLFTSTGSPSMAYNASVGQPGVQSQDRMSVDIDDNEDRHGPQSRHISSPIRQEGRRTRSSTEKEEKRQQKEREDRQREEEARQEEIRQEEIRQEEIRQEEIRQEEIRQEEIRQEEIRQEEIRQEKAREQEGLRAMQLKVAQDKSSVEPEDRSMQKSTQPQRQPSREPESTHATSRYGIPQPKQVDRRPKPPSRDPVQKPEPRPVSIRVGSTMSSRQIPMASSVSSSVQETSAPAPSVSKQPTLKKKGSNQSLQTASSASSLKSSTSSQTQAQRKAQLASERKREQERKRQQDEAKRQELRSRPESRVESRAEAERGHRELSAQEESHRAEIERRREANAQRQGRPASQQTTHERPVLQHEKAPLQSQKSDLGATRPPSRAGPAQHYGRINPPPPNPARPPKRPMNDDAMNRPPVKKISNVHSTVGDKWSKGEDEHGSRTSIRAPMGPPKRVSSKPQPPNSATGSGIFKPGQASRPAPPVNMYQYANGKIPFAEPSQGAPPANAHKPAVPGSVQRTQAQPPVKSPPKYPSGDSIHLPEIDTDSDEDDSDSEMFPVPKWAQAKELHDLLVEQDRMEADSIFGPIAPFSLEETFKADKKIKKYRERTSSANWSGPDGLTQEEIRKDRAERQRLRLNGGWSFQT